MMNKKRNTPYDLNLSAKELQILEKRFTMGIHEYDISELEKKIRRKHPVVPITRSRFFKAAAFWILLISLSLAGYFLAGNPDRGIFKRYYFPFGYQQVTGIYRGMESELYTPYYLYSEKEFSRALPRFRQYLEVNPSDTQAMLLLAVCLIEEKKFTEAESALMDILNSGNYYFHDDVYWYLSLLAVRKGEFSVAREHMAKIARSRKYNTMVQSLSKRIDGRKNR